jgi:hypothetical protein
LFEDQKDFEDEMVLEKEIILGKVLNDKNQEVVQQQNHFLNDDKLL